MEANNLDRWTRMNWMGRQARPSNAAGLSAAREGENWGRCVRTSRLAASEMCNAPLSGAFDFMPLGAKSLPTLIAELRAQAGRRVVKLERMAGLTEGGVLWWAWLWVSCEPAGLRCVELVALEVCTLGKSDVDKSTSSGARRSGSRARAR